MINAAYTLGPWQPFEILDGITIKDYRNVTIAICDYATDADAIELTEAETEANASLIAVAPEMLEALERIATWAQMALQLQTEQRDEYGLISDFNRAILEGLRLADARCDGRPTPMVTIMTDLADCPPHFWIEAQDQFLICATTVAARQALAVGLAPQRVIRTSGMIVRPEFYNRHQTCRADERRRLGLDPELPTGLVMCGGYGSRRMLTIAQRVAESGQPIQLIFICGQNQYLRQQLIAMELPFRCHVEGFTGNVPYFMQLADFFVGKPGPGAISEALVSGLPLIVARNASTMVQERYNAEWIVRNQLGLVIPSFSEIGQAVAAIIDEEQSRRFRALVAMLHNRAVFEIPEILDEIMAMPRVSLDQRAAHAIA